MQIRLRDARLAARLTQKEMADAMTAAGHETSVFSYNKKEHGRRRVYAEEGVVIARTLGKTSEELFG